MPIKPRAKKQTDIRHNGMDSAFATARWKRGILYNGDRMAMGAGEITGTNGEGERDLHECDVHTNRGWAEIGGRNRGVR